MSPRADLACAFLAATDWAEASRRPLAGDASNRRYERLQRDDGQTAVLMDAPPDKGEDIAPFTRIARWLTDQGLSAPRLLAADAAHGFLLLEDLGDALYARVLDSRPDLEGPLYNAAIDTLIAMQRAEPPALPVYDAGMMAGLSALAFTRYGAGVTGATDTAITDAFETRFQHILDSVACGPRVLIHRDYHAENLVWLSDRAGLARVGLLDFQDAMLGHPAYDLVSLLQDARRDVPPEIEDHMIARCLALTGMDGDRFGAAYAALGAQRNLRILGVFARLSLDHGKPHYLDLMPRVWRHLMRNLEHPVLRPVADIISHKLPAPTPENLARLTMT